MKKSTYPWLFAVIILVILFFIVLGLGFSGYFFSISMAKSETDLNLGETICLNLQPNETSVASFTIDGSYMPGERLPQIIQLKANDLDVALKVRVRAEVFSTNNTIDLDFVTGQGFDKAEDGYYYYNQELLGGSKITFSNYIVLPENATFSSKEKYVLSIIVENLNAEFDVNTIWNLENV